MGTDAAGKLPCGDEFMSETIRSGSGKARGLSSTVLMTEKIAVLAPIPSASADIAAARKAGALSQHASRMLKVHPIRFHKGLRRGN